MGDRSIGYPVQDYIIPPDEVHVWRAELDQSRAHFADLTKTLSLAERHRADRFRFDADRTRHVIGRGMARLLLGQCLGVPAESLRFELSREGKPSLAAGFRQPPLKFNISHSGNFVLVALAYGREVGIDIELISKATDAIAARFFSKAEQAALRALPICLRHEAFYSCWTRKEAYLKARGDGLSLALDSFDLAFLPGETPRLIETLNDPRETRHWTIKDLDMGPNYKAALAIEGISYTNLKLWDWTGRPV